MAKLDDPYKPGAREFSWVKLKKVIVKSYCTIDGVVMGYDRGKGKRAAFGVRLAVGIYDPKEEKYLTIAKIGTGMTDDEWRKLLAAVTNCSCKQAGGISAQNHRGSQMCVPRDGT
jgi:DNA ligase-1